MDIFQVIVLSLLQGFTEFLPISSSGHLILTPVMLGWEDQGLAFDIAVHFGTLIAVIFYFRHELIALTYALTDSTNERFPLAWQIVIATVPICIFGLIFADYIESTLRYPLVIAATTIGLGLLLWLSDIFGRRSRDVDSLRWVDAVLIGISQALALVPGTSRSGITMTAGLALGLNREAASKFAFLLSVPAVLAAASWQTFQFVTNPAPVDVPALLIATALSALTAFAAIALFLRFITRIGMGVFAVYRFILGALLIYQFG